MSYQLKIHFCGMIVFDVSERRAFLVRHGLHYPRLTTEKLGSPEKLLMDKDTKRHSHPLYRLQPDYPGGWDLEQYQSLEVVAQGGDLTSPGADHLGAVVNLRTLFPRMGQVNGKRCITLFLDECQLVQGASEPGVWCFYVDKKEVHQMEYVSQAVTAIYDIPDNAVVELQGVFSNNSRKTLGRWSQASEAWISNWDKRFYGINQKNDAPDLVTHFGAFAYKPKSVKVLHENTKKKIKAKKAGRPSQVAAGARLCPPSQTGGG